MQVMKRVKAMFVKPEEKLVELKPKLTELRELVEMISGSSSYLSNLVIFFDAMGRWQDQGLEELIFAFEDVNYGQYDHLLKQIRILDAHFENAGRSMGGMNRTSFGETVTEDRVFLGNIFGLHTKPISYWVTKKDEEKGGWLSPQMDHQNAFDVVSEQARRFVRSHTVPMKKILDELLEVE